MVNLFLAVPKALDNEYWYVYDIILIGVIIVCAVIIAMTKKVSYEKQGEKLVRRARRRLERVRRIGESARLFRIITAKNLIASAEYAYREVAKEKELYLFVDRAEKLAAAKEKLNDIIKTAAGKKPSEEQIDEVLSIISRNKQTDKFDLPVNKMEKAIEEDYFGENSIKQPDKEKEGKN